jgi:hypothetical protein
MIDEMVGRLEQAMHILESEGLSSVPDQMMHRRFVATRVGLLLNLARAGRLVVEQLGRAGTFDLGTIRHTLRR